MKNTKDYIKLILSIMLFFFSSYILVIVLKYGLRIDLANMGKRGLVICDFSLSFILTIILSLIFSDILKTGVKDTKLNYGKKLTQFFTAIIIGYLILIVSQNIASYIEEILFLIAGLERASANNQQIIEEFLNLSPIMMIISACLFAPIEEELLFRGAIRKVIKNKKVFITVSGLIFGLIHVTDSVTLVLEILLLGVLLDRVLNNTNISKDRRVMLSVLVSSLILIIFGGIYYFLYGNLFSVIKSLDPVEAINAVSYVLMGVTLGSLYIYNKENILINIGIHAANNTIAIMLSLFLV